MPLAHKTAQNSTNTCVAGCDHYWRCHLFCSVRLWSKSFFLLPPSLIDIPQDCPAGMLGRKVLPLITYPYIGYNHRWGHHLHCHGRVRGKSGPSCCAYMYYSAASYERTNLRAGCKLAGRRLLCLSRMQCESAPRACEGCACLCCLARKEKCLLILHLFHVW